MPYTRRFKPLAVAVAAAFAAFACGGTSSSTTSGSTANKGTIAIGVDLPQSGGESSNGVPTLNGVKYAVQQIKSVKGFKLDTVNFDDAVNGVHDPQKGAQNVTQMLANPAVLAMVGPFNSNVARAEIPIANAADLVMVSPANTNECLTADFSYCDPHPQALRPAGHPNNYFRVAATDNHQGPAVADYAFDTLHLKKVAVASDNEAYGKGIADNFQKEFEKKAGGASATVLRQDFDTKSTSDFKSFLTSAQSKGAEGIYFGGTDSNKVCTARFQMKGIFGATAPFMGGDGIVTGKCIDDAADNAAGMYGSVAAVDASKVPSAASTISGFKKAFPASTDYGAYSIPAYSAAQAIVAALSKAIDAAGGKMPTRVQVRAAMAKVKKVDTPIGTIGFDSNGDVIPQIITVYQLKSNASTQEQADSPQCGTAIKTNCWVFAKSVTPS
jgi:branched-chain amino acid transport system substrate-binding protein